MEGNGREGRGEEREGKGRKGGEGEWRGKGRGAEKGGKGIEGEGKDPHCFLEKSNPDRELSERSISKGHRGWCLLGLVTCSFWSPPGDSTWSVTFPYLHKRFT